MGVAQVGDPAAGALLPLSLQNTYRARYRAMRPDWQSSGDQLEALVRRYVTPDTRVLDLGCGRGGVVELFWREVKLAAGLDPDVPSLAGHRAPAMPILRGVGERYHMRDFHATILHQLGLNYRDLAYERHGLKERLTDQFPARVVTEILA